MDGDKGTSVVIINSIKGQKLREMVVDSCIWNEAELDILLPQTADSRKSVAPHPNRKNYSFI